MDTVDLGGARLHVVTAIPGVPGDAERVLRELHRLDPAVVLVDLDTDECLRLIESLGRSTRPYALSYVDGLLREEMARRYGGEASRGETHPLTAAARDARAHQRSFIPLRPISLDPGWVRRRRGRAAVRAVPEMAAPRAFADAFARVLATADVWRAEKDVGEAQPRLHRALLDGRAPVAAIVQAHRVAPFLASLHSIGRMVA